MRSTALYFTVVAVVFFCSGPPASAQDGDPDPGLPSALVVDPVDPAVVYAGFAGYGLWKTADGGGTWSRLGGGLAGDRIAGLAVDPFNPSVLYTVESDHGLFKSTNGGLSWRHAGFGLAVAPQEITGIAVDPDDPLTLYAPTRRGLFRSVDGAESFTLLPRAPANPARVFFHPLDSVRMYLVAGETLAVSDDFGDTWQPTGSIGAVPEDVVIDPLATEVFYAATEEGVLTSLDGGRTWGPAGLRGPAWRLAFDATGTLLAVTGEGLFRRDGPGPAWRLLSSFVARGLAVHPFDPTVVYLADRDGEVVSSRDGGAHLTSTLRAAVPPPASLGQPPPPPPPPPLAELRLAEPGEIDNPVAALAVDPDDAAVVWAGTRRGVFKSIDFGEHWQPASAGLELLDVHALAVDPEVTSTIYAGTHGAGLFRSVDGGRTWFPARRGLPLAAVAAVAVDLLEPSVVYAGGRGGLYTSRDHGRSWTLLDDGTAREVRSLRYLEANPLELVAGTAHGRVLGWSVTADEAKPTSGLVRLDDPPRWPPEAFAIDPGGLEVRDLAADPHELSLLYGATVYGLWQSGDGGRRWHPTELNHNVTQVAVDPLDPSVLYVGTTEGLLRRRGGRWSRIKVPGVHRNVTVHSVAAARRAPETVIYAGYDDGAVAVSRDSGETWDVTWPVPRPAGSDVYGTARARWPGLSDRELLDRLKVFYEETPKAALRTRTLLALEHTLRSPVHQMPIPDLLREIRYLQSQRGEEYLSGLFFSFDDRWLVAEHRFDDGRKSHSEMRLYDLEGLRLRSEGLESSHPDLDPWWADRRRRRVEVPWTQDNPWRVLADVAREPEHLHPGWVIADPGDFLDWSPDGRYLATRSQAERISVWRVVKPPRPPESRLEPVRRDDPSEQHLELVAPGLDARAWRSDGRYLALAGPRGLPSEPSPSGQSVVYLADLDRTASGKLDPVRTVFEDKVFDLRFTPEGRWLWIRGKGEEEDRHWGLVVSSAKSWKLVFVRDGDLWRPAPQSRRRGAPDDPLPGAPEAFTELAASADGRWLAGRPAAADGTEKPEVLLWSLVPSGPSALPLVLPAETGEHGIRFSPDSRCLGLERSRLRVWSLRELASSRRPRKDDETDCRRTRWMLLGSGGVLGWPVRGTPERPPPFDGETGEGVVLGGWGCVQCGSRLRVWRRLGTEGWETVDLAAPRDGLLSMSPNRRWIAAAWLDKEHRGYGIPVVRIWDLRTPGPAGLQARSGRFSALELHPDEVARHLTGRQITHWAPPKRGRNDLVDEACQVLGRNLTREEWRRYVGPVPYEPACEFEPRDETSPRPGS